MVSNQTELDHALEIAKLGFRVFPLEPNGKIPVFPAWPKLATRDPERIKNWWIEPTMGVYQGFNIGVTGGLFLDVDCKNGVDGKAALKALTKEYGELPPTIAAQTPSGGEHHYFLADHSVGNSAGKIAPGLDIRSNGGYVVGVGSTINGKSYNWLSQNIDKAVECPTWLVEKARNARLVGPKKVDHVIELDLDDAIERAIYYLENEAKTAVEGAGGDHATFQIAANVKDYGVSETRCAELMLDHWNERCSPPWPPEDLQIKVTNAYQYGVEAAGSKSPGSDFGTSNPSKKTLLAPKRVKAFTGNSLPPREWILGTLLLKRSVSLMVAPPSAGKSTLTLLAAVAIVTGRDDLIGVKVHRRESVWLYNNEDDLDEMNRRLLAILTHFKISWKDLEIDGKIALFLNSGEDRALTISKKMQDGSLVPFDAAPLMENIRKNNIGAFIADPFLETHQASENSNEEINRVSRMFRTIAKKANCSIMLVHHTRKAPQSNSDGHVGNMDSARGASALIGVARVAVTLYSMSAKNAEQCGISDNEKHLYVRLDDAKANMALLHHKPRWFKRVSVKLPNSKTDTELSFDEVGVLEPVTLADEKTTENMILASDVLDAMAGDSEIAATIAKRLIASNPMYQEKKHLTLSRNINKILSTPMQIGDWKIWYEKKDGNHLIVKKRGAA